MKKKSEPIEEQSNISNLLNEMLSKSKESQEEFQNYLEEHNERIYETLSSISRAFQYKEKNINILLIVSTLAMIFSILGAFI